MPSETSKAKSQVQKLQSEQRVLDAPPQADSKKKQKIKITPLLARSEVLAEGKKNVLRKKHGNAKFGTKMMKFSDFWDLWDDAQTGW